MRCSEWENRDSGVWKFKKARQMWLLRWMYRADIVNKATFKVVGRYSFLFGMFAGKGRPDNLVVPCVRCCAAAHKVLA